MADIQDRENLTDAEARQRRYAEGEAIARISKEGTYYPSRLMKDGRIFMVDGQTRGVEFENQDGNLITFTYAAALRFDEAVEDAIDAGVEPEDFEFTLEPGDLTIRKAAYIHGQFAEPRNEAYADEPHYAKPIVGLDVDEDGNAIEDMRVLRRAVKKQMREAAAAPGFKVATGGAFES